ncbi:type III secretion system chaperone family protein [Acaryochloris thomasi]|nr:hypothetical protein [Acaryochloris thomasi]
MKHLSSWVLGIGILSVATGIAWRDIQGQELSRSFARTSTAQLQPIQSPEPPPRSEGATTIQDLEEILKTEAENLQVEGGQLAFSYDGRTMVILTSETHDRMRIIAPIASEDTLTDEQRKELLAANFSSALDGRYAVSNGVIFAAFLHPLSTLDESEFKSALRQVSALVANYGGSYSSGEIQFGAQQEDPLQGLPEI